MIWHELKGNEEISVTGNELLLRKKTKEADGLLDTGFSEIKRIPLFEVKETARFNWDSREVWIEFRGSYYYFSSTETLLQFVDLIQQQFPESVL